MKKPMIPPEDRWGLSLVFDLMANRVALVDKFEHCTFRDGCDCGSSCRVFNAETSA